MTRVSDDLHLNCVFVCVILLKNTQKCGGAQDKRWQMNRRSVKTSVRMMFYTFVCLTDVLQVISFSFLLCYVIIHERYNDVCGFGSSLPMNPHEAQTSSSTSSLKI